MPLQVAIKDSCCPASTKLVKIFEGANYRATAARLAEQPCGNHADELETSIMLAIAPETVDMHMAQTCTCKMTSGPLNRSRLNEPNYSPNGVYGDPRLASKEKGELFVQAMLNDLLV